MRTYAIEAFEDQSRPGGGHAVIRVKGLAEVPDDLTFRLRPVDGGAASDRTGSWPEGDRRPVSTRVTSEGTELVVGPEIVESPHLLPGTLAIIDIPGCGVRGEFLWPSIAPIARPRRRNLVAAKDTRGLPAEDCADLTVAFEEAVDASSALAPTEVAPEKLGSDEALTRAWQTSAYNLAPASPTESSGPAPDRPATPEAPARPPHEVATGRRLEEPAPPHRRGYAGLAVAASVVAAFVAGALATLLLAPAWRGLAPRANGEVRPADGHLSAGVVLELIEPSARSPQGRDTAGMTPDALLETADQLLNGSTVKQDATEARYLLRRYLTVLLAQRGPLWALTQVGSLEAEPSDGTRPSYGRAAAVWELASQLGDPVAMCFLGALHEHGLGVAPDTGAALGLYLRARTAGGCPGIDASLERVRRSSP